MFTTHDVFLLDETIALSQLTRRKNDWYIDKIKKWKWIFSNVATRSSIWPQIANFILPHSYLSLEWALSWYSIIPEFVPVYTSVCSHRTDQFEYTMKTYTYQKIKPSLFFWYQSITHWNFQMRIWFLEKVLLDYFYIHPTVSTREDFESMRFNGVEIRERINWERFHKYKKLYPKTVQRTCADFIDRVQYYA
jgi:hypothetical protein